MDIPRDSSIPRGIIHILQDKEVPVAERAQQVACFIANCNPDIGQDPLRRQIILAISRGDIFETWTVQDRTQALNAFVLGAPAPSSDTRRRGRRTPNWGGSNIAPPDRRDSAQEEAIGGASNPGGDDSNAQDHEPPAISVGRESSASGVMPAVQHEEGAVASTSRVNEEPATAPGLTAPCEELTTATRGLETLIPVDVAKTAGFPPPGDTLYCTEDLNDYIAITEILKDRRYSRTDLKTKGIRRSCTACDGQITFQKVTKSTVEKVCYKVTSMTECSCPLVSLDGNLCVEAKKSPPKNDWRNISCDTELEAKKQAIVYIAIAEKKPVVFCRRYILKCQTFVVGLANNIFLFLQVARVKKKGQRSTYTIKDCIQIPDESDESPASLTKRKRSGSLDTSNSSNNLEDANAKSEAKMPALSESSSQQAVEDRLQNESSQESFRDPTPDCLLCCSANKGRYLLKCSCLGGIKEEEKAEALKDRALCLFCIYGVLYKREDFGQNNRILHATFSCVTPRTSLGGKCPFCRQTVTKYLCPSESMSRSSTPDPPYGHIYERPFFDEDLFKKAEAYCNKHYMCRFFTEVDLNASILNANTQVNCAKEEFGLLTDEIDNVIRGDRFSSFSHEFPQYPEEECTLYREKMKTFIDK